MKLSEAFIVWFDLNLSLVASIIRQVLVLPPSLSMFELHSTLRGK